MKKGKDRKNKSFESKSNPASPGEKELVVLRKDPEKSLLS